MKFTLATLGLLSLASASYSPFRVYPLTAHEPNGDPDGQVDYYHINFTVSSSNGASGNTSAICTKTWSDNSWLQTEAYSMNVPTGSWMACSPSSFSFQLYQYFSIGNFTLGVQQNFTDTTNGTTMLATGSALIRNTTKQYTCTIDPNAEQYIQHASGDCSIPSNSTPILIPITSSFPAPAPCLATGSVNTTFLVSADTSPSQTVLLSGSVPELGSWDPSAALVLSSSDNDGSTAWPDWSGSVQLPTGEGVEYKYLMRESDGSVSWECCENRTWQVPTGECEATGGNDPDQFRG